MPNGRWILAVLLLAAVPAAGQTSLAKLTDTGWEALKQGDGEQAASAFESALRVSPRDAMLHFGLGAAVRLLGRDQDAAESLQRALKIDPKLIPAIVLLGEIEYLQGNSEAAIRRYEEALPFAGRVASVMRSRVNEWRKEAGVHEKLVDRNEARFSITFNGQSENALAARAVGVLERAFWRIAERIGTYPVNRILVTFYTEQQFRDITRAPTWASGGFDGKIRIPTRGAEQDREEFDRVLVHELTHAMITGIAPHGVPAWLHEGLASYFEPRDVDEALRHVRSAGVVFALSDLKEGFGRFGVNDAAVAYDESLVAADLLVRLLGTRLAVLLQALGRGQSFEQSLSQVGLLASDFEAQVMRRLR